MKPPAVPFVPPNWPSFTDRPFGAPIDDYDANQDLAESIRVGFEAIRERKASGGSGWDRAEKAQSAHPCVKTEKGQPRAAPSK